jgi:arginyl-tRNA synthetase
MYHDIPEHFKVRINPSFDFGEINTSICFQQAKILHKHPTLIADEIANCLKNAHIPYIDHYEAKNGYINGYLDRPSFILNVIRGQ